MGRGLAEKNYEVWGLEKDGSDQGGKERHGIRRLGLLLENCPIILIDIHGISKCLLNHIIMI